MGGEVKFTDSSVTPYSRATSSNLEEEILLSKSGKSYYFPYFFVEQPKNI